MFAREPQVRGHFCNMPEAQFKTLLRQTIGTMLTSLHQLNYQLNYQLTPQHIHQSIRRHTVA